LLLGAGHDPDARALGCEQLGDRLPDAATRAGHDCDSSVEATHRTNLRPCPEIANVAVIDFTGLVHVCFVVIYN
jgi:hypothetical protein